MSSADGSSKEAKAYFFGFKLSHFPGFLAELFVSSDLSNPVCQCRPSRYCHLVQVLIYVFAHSRKMRALGRGRGVCVRDTVVLPHLVGRNWQLWKGVELVVQPN